MARRNPALDGKIAEAARAEFLEKGYRGASLRQIAERAGALEILDVRFGYLGARGGELLDGDELLVAPMGGNIPGRRLTQAADGHKRRPQFPIRD